MGRQKLIDRDALLDAAEEIVKTKGPSALTIDALAKKMGITKGGVQYTFGSKDALIKAMFERWGAAYEATYNKVVSHNPTAVERVRAHIKATSLADKGTSAKAAGMMATLLQTPEQLEATRKWYHERLLGLDTTTDEGRRARTAFLAGEGTFLLRYLGLMEVSDETWAEIFTDIQDIAK